MPSTRTGSGILFAGIAFLLWGLLPLYWKALHHVGSMEVLCHRIAWSVPFTALLLAVQSRWNEVVTALREPRTVGLLVCSSVLIACNWFLYIWAVNTGHVVETSLGYFITPLVNVLLGFIFFRDKLRRLQMIAVGLASIGVLVSVIGYGAPPWISLGLAVSFAFYGLVRKVVHIEALPGLFVETVLVGIPATVWLVYLEGVDRGVLFHSGLSTDLLLIGAGAVTSTPLVFFAAGARRLTLATLGVMQYIAPSLAFMLGVFVFHEPFTLMRLVAFLFIWAGVAVYVVEGISTSRRLRRVESGAADSGECA